MIRLSPIDPNEGTLRDLAPDLTPMLDILFILLVFFILTAGAVFKTLNIQLPSAVSEETPTNNNIMVEIAPTEYAVEGVTVANIEELKTAILKAVAQNPKGEIIIAGDKDVSIQRLLGLLTELQAQGITTANILIKNKK